MAGVIPRFVRGPVTYTVVEPIVGGQIVEARTGGLVGVAAAGSLKALGVATKDAAPATDGTGTTPYGDAFLDVSTPQPTCAVDDHGYYPVGYAAAANFGDRLIVAALGKVTPAGATPDSRTVIGYCAEPAGVAAGVTGLARLSI